MDNIGLQLSAAERSAIFGTFDKNGDGQVEMAFLLRVNFFFRPDQRSSSQISFEEFEELMKKSSAAASKKRNSPYKPDAK